MAKLTGKNLFVSFGGTNISGTQRTFSVTWQQEQADVSAGADDYRNFANTMRTIEASCEILVQDYPNGGSATFATLAIGTQGTLLWGPEGTAAGKPKYGFFSTVTELSPDIPFDNAYVLKAKFTNAGTALLYSGTAVWP